MSLAKRGVHRDRPIQGAFPIDGCLTDDSPLEDVFAVWAARVADLNEAIDAHNQAAAAIIAAREGHPCQTAG